MIKKIIGLVSLICLGFWIFFVVNTTLKPKEPNYRCYFGAKDSAVICIHQIDEFDWNEDDFQTIQSNKNFISSIAYKVNTPMSFFVSAKRALIVIERNEKWNGDLIAKLLDKGQSVLTMTGKKTFKYGKYRGCFSGNQLVIFQNEVPPTCQSKIPFEIDKQGSFSLVKFKSTGTVVQDVYKKSDYKIIYETGKCNSTKKHLVDDVALFANNIPKSHESYTFFEKQYLSNNDPVFKNSDIINYVETGIVELTINGKKLLIFDYPGENAINAIKNNNYYEQLEKTTLIKNLKIKTEFLNDTSGYYFAELFGFVYLSSDKATVEKAITEIESNNSLASDTKKMGEMSKYLPSTVSYRLLSNKKQEALSYLDGKYMKSTILFNTNETFYLDSLTKDYFSMDPGNKIIYFCALNGRGNAIVYTENQQLHGYNNGLKKWVSTTYQTAMSPPKLLELSKPGKEIIALRFKDTTILMDNMGRITNYVLGEFISDPIQFSSGNRHLNLFAKSNSLQCFDESASLISTYPMAETILNYSVYYSNGFPYCAVLTKTQLQIIDLSNNLVLRKTNLPHSEFKQLVENGSIVIKEKNSYFSIDNRGVKTKLNIDQSWQLSSSFTSNNVAYMLFTKQNQCSLLKNDGTIVWSKSFPLTEISSVRFSKVNDKPILTVFDGLANSIYLYDFNGVLLDQIKRPANCQAQTTAFGMTGRSITTLLGNILIQYTKY